MATRPVASSDAEATMPDKTVAYVILCHDKAGQALRLAATIRRLSPRARVILRHNRSTGYIDQAMAAGAGADLLVSRLPTRWGDWSLVAAALEAFRFARERHDPDWMVLISGQDYPIRDLAAWERELLEGDDDAVVPGEPLGFGPFGLRPRTDQDGLIMRYTHRWYRLPQLGLVPRMPHSLVRVVKAVWYRYLYPLQAVVTLNELPRENGWVLGVRRRRVPWTPSTPSYKGEQWAALSRRAVAAALDGPLAERWQRYFATTLIPDEAYFPTLLANAPDIRVRRQSISWLRWHDDVAKPHPVIIDREILDEAVHSGLPFARKFDEGTEPGVLDLVDNSVLDLRPAAA
jgi:hypothetical protein